jgi:hypothetical protein
MSEQEARSAAKDRRGRSLFGPLVLIAIGAFFLLDNLGLLPALNWRAAVRLWPMFLIFLGLNLIVRQVPRPLGTLLSGLVSLLAIGAFAVVLLASDQLSFLPESQPADLTVEEISYELGSTEQARVEIDFSSFEASVAALDDSPNLIEGSIAHYGGLFFDVTEDDGETVVSLSTGGTTGSADPLFWLNPMNWVDSVSSDATWQIGLSPDVGLDLLLDLSSGASTLDLRGLTVRDLNVEGSSGRAELWLADGTYDGVYDMSSGRVELHLAERGDQSYTVEGSSGSLSFVVPDSMELRVEVVDDGSGSFNPGGLLERVESGEGDEGAWQTEGYATASDQTVIVLDMSSGSVTVSRE